MVSLLFWATILPCRAQTPTAQITGRITDPTGAVVPKAEVEVTNVDTGIRWQTTSNESGYYTLPVLPPGNYRLTVRQQGFKPMTRSGVSLVVDQVARIDFTLEVGGVTETVEVTSTAPLLESQSASLGQIVQPRAMSDLPLNGRNFLQLAKLATGVVEPSRGDRAAAGGSFVANGVRAQLNNFILDGADNNAKILDIQNSSNVVIQPSVDALQEFKVETHNFSAEFGYSAGAVINATIKSGTNHFHGTAFEFLRASALDARDFFLRPTDRKPAHARHQFGGTLGGPVIRNRTFFFGSWERTRERQGVTIVRTLPSRAERNGDFTGDSPIFDPASTTPSGMGFARTQFAGNMIPANRIDPVATKLLALLPDPNLPGKVNNFVVSPSQRNRRDQYDFRGDQNFSDRDKLFARYSYFTRQFTNPGPFPPPLIGTTNFQEAEKSQSGHGLALGETHLFSASVVNEFRSGYNRIRDFLDPFVKESVAGQFGFVGIPQQAGITGLPHIGISGFTDLGEANFLPNRKISETAQFSDNLSWIRGKHSLKAGGTYRWVRSWFDVSAQAHGSFDFNGVFTQDPQKRPSTGSAFADFLLGVPSSSGLSTVFSGDVRFRYYGFFIEDDWKVTPKLTLNLGARYELWTQPLERHDLQGNFLLNQDKLIFPHNKVPPGIPPSLAATVPLGLGSRSLLKTDTNNLAPRLGLAYQLASRTVLRGGAGVFFAEDPAVGASGRLVGSPPFQINATFPTDQVHPNLTLAGGFPGDALSNLNLKPTDTTFISWDPDFKQAYVYDWSFGLQQEVAKFLIEVTYVGTKGTQLPIGFDYNQPLPGSGSVASRRPIQGFGPTNGQQPMGNSIYNALEVRAERRYARGFSLLASYTHSKSIDYGGEQLIGDIELRDNRNIRLERSLSRSDMRNRFVVSSIYDLPFGKGQRFSISNPLLNVLFGNWQANGIATLRNGQPFTPQLGSSPANTGNPRPDRLADGNLHRGRRTVDHYFDTSAFRASTPFNFGNAGRNILIGPGAVNFDLSTFKRVPVRKLGETTEVQFRAEFFNAFNTPQFGVPNARVDIPQGGSITSVSTRMREIQFGLKIIF